MTSMIENPKRSWRDFQNEMDLAFMPPNEPKAGNFEDIRKGVARAFASAEALFVLFHTGELSKNQVAKAKAIIDEEMAKRGYSI